MSGLQGDGAELPDELLPAETLDGTPLVDPGSMPRQGMRGAAERELPLLEKHGLGPLNGAVRVVPIRRLDGRHFFNVEVEWGPDHEGRDVIGLAGQPSHHVVDTFSTGDHEGALALGQRAIDLLRAAVAIDPYALDSAGGRKPPLSLPALAGALGVEPVGPFASF